MKMNISDIQTSMLVGYTGFVGSNICASHDFTWKINTKNKEEAFGKNPDLLVYAGLRAEKFLANKDPEADLANIMTAFEQIKKINPKKLVLISTVDVYQVPLDVDEDLEMNTDGLLPYGKNRYELEKLVREYKQDALIIRLPGLYGHNLKKNFLYDFIHVVPGMLKDEKFKELSEKNELIAASYQNLGNGFWKCISDETKELKQAFKDVNFSALNFTDSRGIFQFYNLSHLWSDICIALEHDITLLNIATQPVSVADIYQKLTGGELVNEIIDKPPSMIINQSMRRFLVEKMVIFYRQMKY